MTPQRKFSEGARARFVLFYVARVELAARDVAAHDVAIMSFKFKQGMMKPKLA